MCVRLATAKDIDSATEQIGDSRRIFVDTEFHAERRYRPKLFLVQVQVPGGDTWLIDPLVEGLLEALGPALASVPWVVHGGTQDLRILHRRLGRVPDEVLDTQIGAGLLQAHFPLGLGALLDTYLDQRLDKASTLSDWSLRPLAKEQIRYAAEDVALLPELWGAIETQLERRDRLALAKLASEHLKAEAITPSDPDEHWRQIPGSGNLTPPQAAVLQELAGWRERRARQRTQPARAIISDSLLRSLAKRQPITVDSLQDNRRMPKSIAKRLGAELVDLIARGQRRPKWGWPNLIRPGSDRARQMSFLQTYAQLAGRDHGFAPNLVLPDTVLESLVLRRPSSRADLATRLGPWRDELAGHGLWGVLAGDVHLRLAADDITACP